LGGSVVKCYALYFQFVNTNRAKRGFFSVSQRVLLLTRGILVFHDWFHYFRSLQTSWPLWVYIFMKTVFTAHLALSLPLAAIRYARLKAKVARRVSMKEVKDNCAVCISVPTAPCKLPCGHIFCQDCLERWLVTNPTCPTCRRETLKPMDVRPSEATTDWVFFLYPF
jgi:hypothetical protein